MRILFLFLASSLLAWADEPLNVVLIFTDDQGYNDLGCFGSETIKTPNLDQLASEGRKFTSFYVASPICTPSRAALLTGCYPKRVELAKGVLFPNSTTGLNPKEYTLGDHFSAHGYATACIGKWHLGHHPEVLPTANGFDSYYGIPYSNDMNHLNKKKTPPSSSEGMDVLWNDPESAITAWQTPLMKNEEIIELPVDQRTITRRYTDRAIEFINQSAESKKPFFLYLPHSMPHIPLYVPDEVRDPDSKNAYRNVIEHIDHEVGRLMTTLRESKLAENTLVIFTSDNGPWLRFKHHGGSAKPLRNGKTTNFEGGQRVPCLMWAPGRIPANTVCSDMLSTMDLLPSLCSLTGTTLPDDLTIDGLDASTTIVGKETSPRSEFLYYSQAGQLTGIRQGDWKLLLLSNKKEEAPKTHLFNLAEDLSEKKNLAKSSPKKVTELTQRMQECDREIAAGIRPSWKKVKTP